LSTPPKFSCPSIKYIGLAQLFAPPGCLELIVSSRIISATEEGTTEVHRKS
jgi:hypothetical protein